MCGIVGTYNLTKAHLVLEDGLRRMLGMIRHRGPDQFGIYLDEEVGLGNARLSIVDVDAGQQPISNENGDLWIVFNGEIFNHVELRPTLEARGHRFSTRTDTEVVLHLYEEFGPDCLHHLNGDFAIAIWDARSRSLFLARDRVGVRPLFYTVADGALIFGSEIKAILADARVRAVVDPVALDQIFTFWSPLPSRSAFRGIQEVPPGHYLQAGRGRIEVRPYWRYEFRLADDDAAVVSPSRTEQYAEELQELLIDAVKIRLRADVQVGAYLSGGLDSSMIAAIVRGHCANNLETFSIAFDDPAFDESGFQRLMAGALGTEHRSVLASHADIGRVFPSVIWHAEMPLLRTGPAPMYLLSRFVRDCKLKVVLTGEGADEFFAGYDLFKEAKIRRFWARQPTSKLRPLLLRRLYPDITGLSRTSTAYLAAFFADGLTDLDSPHYSHAIRWRNTRRLRRFFTDDLADGVRHHRAGEGEYAVSYPDDFMRWGPLERAQYLESTIFLPQYLLSAQGDRAAMAHSVEGRFPFLDYRIVEFCGRLPSGLKLRGLTDKYLLRRVGRRLVPPEIGRRPKRPYRAPIHRSFFNGQPSEYVRDLLSPGNLAMTGYFKPDAVARLVSRIGQNLPTNETDDMALAGILSTQLVHQQFVSGFRAARAIGRNEDCKVRVGSSLARAQAP
jgi:asparagine synthase (glutamine-hydrolysing)